VLGHKPPEHAALSLHVVCGRTIHYVGGLGVKASH
jgi:hypothetical protein